MNGVSAANQKVWVCMTCAEVHFNPDEDYAACWQENHQMYVGFVWPIEADQEKPEPTDRHVRPVTASGGRAVMTQPISQRRRTIYCDECQLWLPCHKYDARYRAEEVLYLCDVCVLEVLPIVDKETSPVGELFAYPGATAPDPAVVEARRLTAQRAIAVCQIHFEHSLNFLGQRVGRATHASPWHPCSVGDAIHEGMADA